MGLSQLYQLRAELAGATAAYAYFTYKPNKVLTEVVKSGWIIKDSPNCPVS